MNWPHARNASETVFSTLTMPTSTFQNSQFHNNLPPYTNQSFMFELEQRHNDEDFVNKFIKNKIKRKTTEKRNSTLKIFEAKKYLKEIISLKIELETLSEVLDVNSNDFDIKWEEIICKQKKINDLFSAFDNDSLESLKNALKKRKKKRNWEKRRRIREKNERIELLGNLQVKHALIEKLLSEKSKEAESAKRTEALKRQADLVLHEVRKKKYEAKKVMKMLSALSKLRELRIQQEVARGGYSSKEVTETFNKVISQFQELWSKQSEIYNLEEKGLKVMLEESESPQIKISNLQKILNQWEHAFFGSPSSDEICRFLTLADENINTLMMIRRDWDQYISDHSTVLSSCIPVGWVSPPETDNEDWKAFLRLKKNQKL